MAMNSPRTEGGVSDYVGQRSARQDQNRDAQAPRDGKARAFPDQQAPVGRNAGVVHKAEALNLCAALQRDALARPQAKLRRQPKGEITK